MMHHVRRLIGDERGTSFEGIALSVSIIAVGFVASADVLDYMSRKHGGEIGTTMRTVASIVHPASAPPQGIDYTPTASLPDALRARTTLDPCTGLKK